MTEETVDCFNCGRTNPEWAQVCRSCGVALRHGEARITPTGPFPTDRDSLISIGAVIGTIVAAVLIGLFVSSLNPTEPTIGQESPTPEPTIAPTAAPTPEPTPEPTEEPTPEPEPEPEPELPGRLAFGTELDADRRVVDPVETFTPGATFAYSITMDGGFGEPQIFNEVVRIVDDAEEATVLEREGVNVDPAADNFGYVIGQAGSFVAAWGPGQYEWRVYVGDELVARERFRLAEG